MNNWIKKHIDNQQEFDLMLIELEQDNPLYIGMDTETTGLNLSIDKAFLLIVGWNNKTYTFDLMSNISFESINKMYDLFSRCNYLFFWNTKYDLHMLANAGIPYNYDNLSDGMILASFLKTVEARGGLGLKGVAEKYVDINAKYEQDNVKRAQSVLTRERISQLNKLLKPLKTNSGKVLGVIKDPLQGVKSLDKEVFKVYKDWLTLNNHSNIYNKYQATYLDIYNNQKQLMLQYAFKDVIYMMEFVCGITKMIQWVLSNEDYKIVFERESKLVRVLYEQERTGWKVDEVYLDKSIKKVKEVISIYRAELAVWLKEEVGAYCHPRIKSLLKLHYKFAPPKLDKVALENIYRFHNNPVIKRIAFLISTLRRLEKWYGTYLIGIKTNLENGKDSKIYTQFNSFGTKTGRLSSNFQQSPKEGIILDGKLLFHPRKLIVPFGGDYPKMYYFDYSQVEMRFQCELIIIWFGGDRNLMSAFINVDNDPNWVPTDLHSSTFKPVFAVNECKSVGTQFGSLSAKTGLKVDESHPNFAKYRAAAKVLNFSAIYGAGERALIANPHLSDFEPQQIKDLLQGYRTNYPKVAEFSRAASAMVKRDGVIKNLYNRIYKFSDFNHLYKASNYIIQGSAADFLKEKMILCYNFIKENKLKTLAMGNIHDEIQFAIPDNEKWIIPKIKEIMEDSNTRVPIVVDIEVSDTSWADKVDYKG